MRVARALAILAVVAALATCSPAPGATPQVEAQASTAGGSATPSAPTASRSSEAVATPSPVAMPSATASPSPLPSIRITAETASPDVETLKAVLATIPRVPGQPSGLKNELWQCPNSAEDDDSVKAGLVYWCYYGPDGYDFHDRVATIGVRVYKDAASARALFDKGGKKMKAPALGEASRMYRVKGFGCETVVDVLQANVMVQFDLEGFGTFKPDSVKCRSYASLPTAWLKSSYRTLSAAFVAP